MLSSVVGISCTGGRLFSMLLILLQKKSENIFTLKKSELFLGSVVFFDLSNNLLHMSNVFPVSVRGAEMDYNNRLVLLIYMWFIMDYSR